MTTATVHDHQDAYPRAWRWNEDGSVVTGTHVRFDEVVREGRGVGIHVLEVSGEERGIWVWYVALETKIGDELARRPNGDLDVGETVRYERLPKKTAQSGHGYWPFLATFGNATERRRAPREIFRASAEIDGGGAPAQADHDDIPF